MLTLLGFCKQLLQCACGVECMTQTRVEQLLGLLGAERLHWRQAVGSTLQQCDALLQLAHLIAAVL